MRHAFLSVLLLFFLPFSGFAQTVEVEDGSVTTDSLTHSLASKAQTVKDGSVTTDSLIFPLVEQYNAALQFLVDHGDPLKQFPGNRRRQHSSHFRLVLPHDEPHLRRLPAASRTPHALQKRGHGPWRVNLKSALETAQKLYFKEFRRTAPELR